MGRITVCDTLSRHRIWPIIWSDNKNILHIASTKDCKQFEWIDIRENKWNKYIPNNNKSFNDVFGTIIDSHTFESRLLISHNIL